MKIALLGDMAFYGKYSLEDGNVEKRFDKISQYLKKFDYVVGNLETPFCNVCKPIGAKSAHIKSIEENVKLLKLLNVKIVNLSNNHIFDYGLKGYFRTLELLKDNGIEYFGVEDKILNFKKDNNQINFFGYTCISTNPILFSKEGKYPINLLVPKKVEEDLERHKHEGLNIISFHMGQEHVNYPNYDHVRMARKIADKYSYILYGHHPHVIQGVEEYKKSILAYSLGNFCFDDVYINDELKIKQSENNKTGIILILEIENNCLRKYEIRQIYQKDNCIELRNLEISNYNNNLNLNPEEYISFRENKYREFYYNYIKKRNFQWYIKRLRFKYFIMLYNEKRNFKLYNKYIKKYFNGE